MARQQLTVIEAHELLLERDVEIKNVLPKSLKWERFSTRSKIWMAKNKGLLGCTKLSLFEAFFECASDGLVPDGIEAIIVPYLDKRNKVMLAQYQPMYQGLLKRGRQLGDLHGVDCEVVYDKDFFELVGGDSPRLDHRPYRDGPRGQLRAVYAIFRDRQGRILHRACMFRADIDKRRRESKHPEGPAWTTWYEEMARKTVLRNGLKFVPTISDELRVMIEREDRLPTVLEGVAVPSGGSSARSQVRPLSLDDLDEDGNLIVRRLADAGGEPEDEDEDHVEDAEILRRDAVQAAEAQGRADDFDDVMHDHFGVTWSPPPVDPVKVFADALRRCTNLADAKAMLARHRPKMRTVPQREAATLAWRATRARLARLRSC